MLKNLIGIILIGISPAVFAQSIGPAPAGDPKLVATQAIKAAEHPCEKVKVASRNRDGSVTAICVNKEDYRVFSIDSKTVTMRCSVVRKLGVSGC